MRSSTVVLSQLCLAAAALCQNASIQIIDPLAFATDPGAAVRSADSPPVFQVFNSRFLSMIGSNASISLIAEEPIIPLYHEAGVYISSNPTTIFTTSNQFSSSSGEKTAVIGRIVKQPNGTYTSEIITPDPPIPFVNGGFKYKDGIVFNAQGNLTANGGLTFMSTTAPFQTTVLLNSYFGIPFDSPNDVFVTSDGAMWFTDNPVGFPQGIRPNFTLPGATYRFVPNTTELRMVNDDFREPNGLTFSPDESTAYITAMDGLLDNDPRGRRTIYQFDVTYPDARRHADGANNGTAAGRANGKGQPFLTNRRVFAYAAVGIADGIKTDTEGNVWAGCGDGINVWDSAGVLLGKIVVSGGVANFALGKGEVFLFNEKKLFLATVAPEVIGQEARDL